MSTLHRRPNMPDSEFLEVVKNGLKENKNPEAICVVIDNKWQHPNGKKFSPAQLSMKLSQIRTKLSEAVLKKAAKQKEVTVEVLQADKNFAAKLEKFLDEQVPSLRTGRSKSTSLLEGIDLSMFDEDEQELLTDEVEQ